LLGGICSVAAHPGARVGFVALGPRPAPTTTAHARPGRRPLAAMATVMHASVWSCGTQTSMWIRLRWGAARPPAGTRTMAAAARVDQVLIGLSPRSWEPARHARTASSRADERVDRYLHGCTADVSAGTPSSRATSKICGPARRRAPVASRTLPSSGMSFAVVPGRRWIVGGAARLAGAPGERAARRPGRRG
jgi:hypothetical protein